MMFLFFFFFFKQKTAYEIPLCDWSSDVCSSDLSRRDRRAARSPPFRRRARALPRRRSEEHTSELQSHSGISYAVFCLKKKIEHLFVASTHAFILFFTNVGIVYRLKFHALPLGSRQSKGRVIVNLFFFRQGETVRADTPLYTLSLPDALPF